jgi:hypothetical protein
VSDEENTGSPQWHAYLLLAFIVAGFLSLAVRPGQSRICEEENGFEYVVVECEHRFLLAKLFYPSDCSFTYRPAGGRRMSSFQEPAKALDGVFEFTASRFMTSDPDIQVFERAAPILVRVDFDNYRIETRGAINGRFFHCRGGSY